MEKKTTKNKNTLFSQIDHFIQQNKYIALLIFLAIQKIIKTKLKERFEKYLFIYRIFTPSQRIKRVKGQKKRRIYSPDSEGSKESRNNNFWNTFKTPSPIRNISDFQSGMVTMMQPQDSSLLAYKNRDVYDTLKENIQGRTLIAEDDYRFYAASPHRVQ